MNSALGRNNDDLAKNMHRNNTLIKVFILTLVFSLLTFLLLFVEEVFGKTISKLNNYLALIFQMLNFVNLF